MEPAYGWPGRFGSTGSRELLDQGDEVKITIPPRENFSAKVVASLLFPKKFTLTLYPQWYAGPFIYGPAKRLWLPVQSIYGTLLPGLNPLPDLESGEVLIYFGRQSGCPAFDLGLKPFQFLQGVEIVGSGLERDHDRQVDGIAAGHSGFEPGEICVQIIRDASDLFLFGALDIVNFIEDAHLDLIYVANLGQNVGSG